MDTLFQCHPNLIGITQKECDCYDPDEKDFNISESTSTLYIDQFVEMAAIAYTECGDSFDVFDKANAAMIQAESQLKADVLIQMRSISDQKPTYSGLIGKERFRNVLANTGTYRGTKYDVKQVRGAYARIKGVSVLFDSGTDANIFVKTSNNNDDFAIKTVEPTANTWTYKLFPEPIDVPLWSEGEALTDYSFYIYSNKNGALDAEEFCLPCSGSKPEWMRYFTQHGFTSDSNDIDDLISSNPDKYLHGIRPDIEVVCDASYDLCKANGVERTSLAYAWVLLSSIILLRDIANSGEVNRYTVYNSEMANKRIDQLQSDYMEYIKYLASTLSQSECFSCNSRVKVGKILA